MVSLCPAPLTSVSLVAAPEVPRTEKVIAGNAATDAVIAFTPTRGPSVHPPGEATPALLVTWVRPVAEPAPAVTEKTTVTPAIGFPLESPTITAGSGVTAAPAILAEGTGVDILSVAGAGGGFGDTVESEQPDRIMAVARIVGEIQRVIETSPFIEIPG